MCRISVMAGGHSETVGGKEVTVKGIYWEIDHINGREK